MANHPNLDRRDFLSRISSGLHGAALASLLGADLYKANPALAAHAKPKTYDLSPKPTHFQPRAKAVIQLFMNGGPSQVDLFDPKQDLKKYAGKTPSRDLTAVLVTPQANAGILPSPYEFKPRGQSGLMFSELLPHMAGVADEFTMIRSMVTKSPNHEPALALMHTGRALKGRPSWGAWVTYGLGSQNQNLPAYVVLDDPQGLPLSGIANWQAGWLPPVYQGTRFRAQGDPVLNLRPRQDWPHEVLDAERSLLRRLDQAHLQARPNEPDLHGRIASYELAARMQLEASDAVNIDAENEATREAYGLNDAATESYGRRCLMARRLVERGVRFVQIYIERQIWDAHSKLDEILRDCCGKTDKPTAALIRDLKQRGMLDDTLVLWGGEFGRLPLGQGDPDNPASLGRDHGPSGFTTLLAGGGVKGGAVYGSTDELGNHAAENPVSVHDYHATLLHLLGMNYRDLVFKRHGLGERLTDQFAARVIKEILA